MRIRLLRLRGKRTTSAAVLLALALAVPLGAQATASPPEQPAGAEEQQAKRQYEVTGVSTAAQRDRLTALGVAIDEVHDHAVVVTVDRAYAAKLKKRGYELTALPTPKERKGLRAAAPDDYHNYEQMMAAVDGYLEQYPDLMSSEVVGTSHEGRDIIAVKVSSNVKVDEDKPEVLFTHNMHAREHLTTEMALYTLGEFGSQYGSDERITQMLDERELWIIPSVNPDGKEYDTESGSFRMWRKNRQPNSGSSALGTDLNRNFDYNWGCCGGSSGSPSSSTYRGSAPESGTEAEVVADFVRGRVVDGEQQLTAHIDFHTYSELVLWPYGYTYDDTDEGLTQDDRDAFAAVGTEMADSNGYKPQQSSDLYITDGTINDWMWGEQRIFSYTFEMYPPPGHPDGFYPPGSVIDRETARNKDAMLILLENADCMYRSIGKEGEYCET